MSFFKRTGAHSEGKSPEGVTRYSRGWGELNKFLHEREGLRVLDFGTTSSANINYLTQLGHSVYMANAVSDAAAAEWRRPTAATGPGTDKDAETASFDVERFCSSNLSFSGRVFDVILLWDTASYLPPELVAPFFRRLREVLQPGGRLLAFFHAKTTGPETTFSRYQLSATDDLMVLRSGPYPVLGLYHTRQIEKYFAGFADTRFFLGKDNIREVYAVR